MYWEIMCIVLVHQSGCVLNVIMWQSCTLFCTSQLVCFNRLCMALCTSKWVWSERSGVHAHFAHWSRYNFRSHEMCSVLSMCLIEIWHIKQKFMFPTKSWFFVCLCKPKSTIFFYHEDRGMGTVSGSSNFCVWAIKYINNISKLFYLFLFLLERCFFNWFHRILKWNVVENSWK